MHSLQHRSGTSLPASSRSVNGADVKFHTLLSNFLFFKFLGFVGVGTQIDVKIHFPIIQPRLKQFFLHHRTIRRTALSAQTFLRPLTQLFSDFFISIDSQSGTGGGGGLTSSGNRMKLTSLKWLNEDWIFKSYFSCLGSAVFSCVLLFWHFCLSVSGHVAVMFSGTHLDESANWNSAPNTSVTVAELRLVACAHAVVHTHTHTL